MPRRKPDGKSVIVHRFELGDFERRQLEDVKMAVALRSAAPILGGGLLAIGVLGAGYFVNKNLDDLQEWYSDNRQGIFGLGATQEEIEAMSTSQVADLPADALTGIDISGLSPAAVYDLLYQGRDSVRLWMFSDWCAENGVSETGANYKYFRENATSILGSFAYADIELREGNSVSMFAYQMSIRETAARRNQGRATSGLVGALLPINYLGGLFASEAVWGGLSALGIGHANEWKSGDVREAPGYIADPLLTWSRTIVDFAGPDAGTFGTMTNPATGTQVNIASMRYPQFIVDSMAAINEPIDYETGVNPIITTLRGFCPPAPQ